MDCDLKRIESDLRAGPGIAVWCAERDAAYDALVDAGTWEDDDGAVDAPSEPPHA